MSASALVAAGKNARRRVAPATSSSRTPRAPCSHAKFVESFADLFGGADAQLPEPRSRHQPSSFFIRSRNDSDERAGLALGRRRVGLQGLALAGAELARNFQDQPVAGVAAAPLAQARHPVTAQADDLVGLGARSNGERFRAVQHRNLDLVAAGQLRERHGDVAVEIGAVPDEQLVLRDPHQHVEIPGRPALHTASALSGEAELHAVLDARGDLHLEHALGALTALAAAGLARVLVDLPLSVALRARPRNGEESLTHPDLAAASAGVAGLPLGSGLAAASVAALARLRTRDLNLRLHARRRLFQGQLHLVLEVLPAPTAAAPAALASGEEVLEDVLEQGAEAGLEAARPPHGAEAVVLGALVGIGEDRVRLVHGLEVLLGLLVPGVAVRVVLHGELAVGLLELRLARRARDAEDLVVVAPGHLTRRPRRAAPPRSPARAGGRAGGACSRAGSRPPRCWASPGDSRRGPPPRAGWDRTVRPGRSSG